MNKARILLALLLGLFSIGAYSQVNLTGKAIRSFNADSATVRAETVGLELMYDSVGVMYLNWQTVRGGDSIPTWRCYATGRGWYDCAGSGGGGGGTITANNGLIMSTATNVQLGSSSAPGRALIHDTFIDATASGFNLTIDQSSGGLFRLEGAGSDGLSFDPDQIGASNDLSITSSDNLFLGLATSNASLSMTFATNAIILQNTLGAGDLIIRNDGTSTGSVLLSSLSDIRANTSGAGHDIVLTAASNGQIVASASGAVTIESLTDDINILASGGAGDDVTINGNILNLLGGQVILQSFGSGIQIDPATNSDEVTITVNSGAGGFLLLVGLPTSSAGLAVNTVYDSLGFLKRKH